MRFLSLSLLLILSFAWTSRASAEQSWLHEFGDTLGGGIDEYGTGSYLGVDINDVTSDRISVLKLKDEHGVEVVMVDGDSPAGKAGIKEHDVILSLNGTPVESGAQLRRLIRETPPGRQVTLEIWRNGQPVTLKAQLADRRKALAWKEAGRAPNAEVMPLPPIPAMPDFDIPSVVVVHSSNRSGLLVENMTPQLGEFFGVRSGQGVLIRSVEKGSQAEKAGLRAGDVIVRINEQKVSDVSDFSHAMRARKASSVTVGIVRDKREQNISLSMPERKQSELMDGDWEVPEISVDMQKAFSELNSKLAALKPQMTVAMNEARAFQQREMKKQMGKMKSDFERFSDEQKKLLKDQLKSLLEKDDLI